MPPRISNQHRHIYVRFLNILFFVAYHFYCQHATFQILLQIASTERGKVQPALRGGVAGGWLAAKVREKSEGGVSWRQPRGGETVPAVVFVTHITHTRRARSAQIPAPSRSVLVSAWVAFYHTRRQKRNRPTTSTNWSRSPNLFPMLPNSCRFYTANKWLKILQKIKILFKY